MAAEEATSKILLRSVGDTAAACCHSDQATRADRKAQDKADAAANKITASCPGIQAASVFGYRTKPRLTSRAAAKP